MKQPETERDPTAHVGASDEAFAPQYDTDPESDRKGLHHTVRNLPRRVDGTQDPTDLLSHIARLAKRAPTCPPTSAYLADVLAHSVEDGPLCALSGALAPSDFRSVLSLAMSDPDAFSEVATRAEEARQLEEAASLTSEQPGLAYLAIWRRFKVRLDEQRRAAAAAARAPSASGKTFESAADFVRRLTGTMDTGSFPEELPDETEREEVVPVLAQNLARHFAQNGAAYRARVQSALFGWDAGTGKSEPLHDDETYDRLLAQVYDQPAAHRDGWTWPARDWTAAESRAAFQCERALHYKNLQPIKETIARRLAQMSVADAWRVIGSNAKPAAQALQAAFARAWDIDPETFSEAASQLRTWLYKGRPFCDVTSPNGTRARVPDFTTTTTTTTTNPTHTKRNTHD